MDNTKKKLKQLDIREGVVIESLPSTTFKVEIGSDEIILAHLSGKMRIHHIRIYPGDKVFVRISEDGRRGIITRRL